MKDWIQLINSCTSNLAFLNHRLSTEIENVNKSRAANNRNTGSKLTNERAQSSVKQLKEKEDLDVNTKLNKIENDISQWKQRMEENFNDLMKAVKKEEQWKGEWKDREREKNRFKEEGKDKNVNESRNNKESSTNGKNLINYLKIFDYFNG